MSTEDMRQHFESDGSPRRLDSAQVPALALATGCASDGILLEVAARMAECATAWEPGARLIGNCRACDIAAVARGYLRQIKIIEEQKQIMEITAKVMNMTPKTDTQTLASAMDALARHTQSSDGVANAAMAEAAQRLRELEHELEIANRDAGMYAATLTLTARHLDCDEHMVDVEVKRLLPDGKLDKLSELEEKNAEQASYIAALEIWASNEALYYARKMK